MAVGWIRADDYEAMSRLAAARICRAAERGLRGGQPMCLGLATGNTMLTTYRLLAEALNRRRLNLARLHTFNLDEYIGADGAWIPLDHPLSYRAYMQRNLFSRLDPALAMDAGHVHFPDPARPADFDELIRGLGGLDLQLLGIGFNGHIAFNEPMREAEIAGRDFAGLPTRVVELTELTVETNARLTAGGDRSSVPRRAVSVGMKTILAAREVLLLACFAEQAASLDRVRGGSATPELPASYLLNHPKATIIYAGDVVCLQRW